MTKKTIHSRNAVSGTFKPVASKGNLQTFVVKSVKAGRSLASNRHSTEKERIEYSRLFLEESKAYAARRVSKLKMNDDEALANSEEIKKAG